MLTSRPESELTISVQNQQLGYNGRWLDCPTALLPFFIQLTLNFQKQLGGLNEAQWQLCAVVACVKKSSLVSELYRYNTLFNSYFGFPCLQNKKGIGLIPHSQITALRLDVSNEQAKQFIYPYEQKQSMPALMILYKVERLFEQGEYHKAAYELQSIWKLTLHPTQTIAAKCWDCWIELRRSGDGQYVRQKTRELSRWFNDYAKEHGPIPDIVKARVFIQLARTSMAYQQDDAARRRYAQAHRLLPAYAWREQSSIQAGMGYIATRSGNLLEGEMYYRLALHHATLAHWPWSVQIQLGNLADVLYERYLLLHAPIGPHPLLSEALQLLEQSQLICDQYGFRGSGDTELYRARYAILLGDLALASELIEQAFVNVETSQTHYDLPLTWTVKAELQLAQGHHAAAKTSLEKALVLEEALQTGIDSQKLRQRLAEL